MVSSYTIQSPSNRNCQVIRTTASHAQRPANEHAASSATPEDTLNEKYRLVFVLRDIEEQSTRETAAILDLTAETVKVRLLRARLMLRERLTRLFGDETTLVASHDHAHG